MNMLGQKRGCLPVLLEISGGGKYYFLHNELFISHFSYQKECWKRLQEIDFQVEEITCFEAAVDLEGTLHIFVCETGKTIYHAMFPDNSAHANSAHESTAHDDGAHCREILYQETERKIEGFSCFSSGTNTYLLCLITSEARKMWWIYIFHYNSKTHNKWQGPFLLDFGYGNPGACGFVCSDLKGNIFTIYLLTEGEVNRPVFRELLPKPGSGGGETVYLQGEKQNSSMPVYLIASDSLLHLSWLSKLNDRTCLHYARKKPSGRWELLLNKEVHFNISPFISISELDGILLIVWESENTFYHIISEDGGTSWSQEKQKSFETPPETVRFRSSCFDLKKRTLYGNYIHCHGTPPQAFWGPEQFTKTKKESPPPPEITNLNMLSSKLICQSQKMQRENFQLQKQVDQKEHEIKKMQSWSHSYNQYLSPKMEANRKALEKMEVLFNTNLKNLQEKLETQKKDFLASQEMLNRKIRFLEKENTRLSKELSRQTKIVIKMEKEIAGLKKEKHENRQSMINRFFDKMRL